MTNAQADDFGTVWSGSGSSRIPAPVYTDPAIYARELERIFYGPHWNYVGLDVEVPDPGCFKRTSIGERSVIVIRNRAGEINVLENRCAHRAMRFCQERSGKVKTLVCPYHQWNYNHDGKLLGVPFQRGVKGQGGMPDDFRLEDHALNRLNVAISRAKCLAILVRGEDLLEFGPGSVKDLRNLEGFTRL